MDVLFIHQAFPAQFGRLALELSRRYGWRCRFLVETYSSCPTPSGEMLEALEIHRVRDPRETPKGGVPWPRVFGRWLEQCLAYRSAYEGTIGDDRPDLIVAHGGQGAPIALLRELADAPIVNYCEYYFPNRFADLTYRVDLPPAELAPFYPRCINAPTLLALQASDAGYAPTRFQHDSFPERYRPEIEVHFDGVDTELYRPREVPSIALPDGRTLGPGRPVVTYVSRGLESMRGFDLFVEVAGRIARGRPDAVFVVAGAGTTYYGWDDHATGGADFRSWSMAKHGADASRFAFLGHVEPGVLAAVLARSDLHLFPSVPFVPSWSLFNAMASGCVVLGADVEPVREVIEEGRTGLLAPLFDAERWADRALEVLDRPGDFEGIGRAAAARIRGRYGLDSCVPDLRDYFERVASRGRVDGR
ncbi:glycosyltransferase [Tautonia plasticadhaerens]|uniref:Alpha-D-kanosaminyltransferase n=1 Tax=Tautonia plasticadhaerens TaxID=2527974 RepID=A0A518HB42_9BACT|nr:glycosyltransferase [Tautonia plasticadhaerens]QDV37936.1 Alpha-D-kanosaminyltransferase [Tautonia plasticadhaerens]